MDSRASKLKSLAVSLGADIVGVTTKEILADGPPSADPSYLLPRANSVISFALSLDRDKVRGFISKTKWRPHCLNRKAAMRAWRFPVLGPTGVHIVWDAHYPRTSGNLISYEETKV
jgi:hypothetical protein